MFERNALNFNLRHEPLPPHVEAAIRGMIADETTHLQWGVGAGASALGGGGGGGLQQRAEIDGEASGGETALLFSSSKPKPSELQLRKGALLRRTPRPCLAHAPLPLPI